MANRLGRTRQRGARRRSCALTNVSSGIVGGCVTPMDPPRADDVAIAADGVSGYGLGTIRVVRNGYELIDHGVCLRDTRQACGSFPGAV